MSTGGDADLDGWPDVLIGSVQWNEPRHADTFFGSVYWLSGATLLDAAP